MPISKITTCLWFDGDAEEAARFYTSIVPDSVMGDIGRAPLDYPAGKAGDVLTVEFVLGGTAFVGLNGGPNHPFNDAVSFQIACADQAEVDRLWAALGEGGEYIACSWLKDRWGLRWQIVPTRLTELMKDPDADRARRVMEAMMGMVKIDVAAIERAAVGA